ncbi:hypothetical protein OYC64_012232 [Pagothenia borchgrevinki]|uniref:Uncharacterized protein n=1 Tax=Pagothenia borchgrevinki TaxID=8213 RepID=A0ABD2G850_PAGBO
MWHHWKAAVKSVNLSTVSSLRGSRRGLVCAACCITEN